MGKQIIRKSTIRALSKFFNVGGTGKMLLTDAFTVEITRKLCMNAYSKQVVLIYNINAYRILDIFSFIPKLFVCPQLRFF